MKISGMPNVPNIAGLASASSEALLSLGSASLINAVFGNRWGIVNQYGVPVLLSDTVISVNYENSQETSKDPIENGKVMTYNKINNPRKCSVVIAKGKGSSLSVGAWLTQIEIYANSTLKFHIITPEYVFMNMQIVNTSHARTAQNGLQLIQVKIDFEECKIAKVKYDTEEVKKPQDAQPIDNGKVQASENSSGLYKLGQGVLNIIGNIAGN